MYLQATNYELQTYKLHVESGEWQVTRARSGAHVGAAQEGQLGGVGVAAHGGVKVAAFAAQLVAAAAVPKLDLCAHGSCMCMDMRVHIGR